MLGNPIKWGVTSILSDFEDLYKKERKDVRISGLATFF